MRSFFRRLFGLETKRPSRSSHRPSATASSRRESERDDSLIYAAPILFPGSPDSDTRDGGEDSGDWSSDSGSSSSGGYSDGGGGSDSGGYSGGDSGGDSGGGGGGD